MSGQGIGQWFSSVVIIAVSRVVPALLSVPADPAWLVALDD